MSLKRTLRNVGTAAVTMAAVQAAFAYGPIDYSFGGTTGMARDVQRAELRARLVESTQLAEVTHGERGYVFKTAPSTRTVQFGAATQLAEVTHGERGYVFRSTPSTRTRAEVVAELREAVRIGAYAAGESGLPVTTPEQEARIYAAGQRAAPDAADSTR